MANEALKRGRRIRIWLVLVFLIGLMIGVMLGFAAGVQIGYGKGAIELTMVYGSEKQGWIEEVTPQFLDWWKIHHPEKPLILHFTPMGSRESLIQIMEGSIRPVVWSPASSVWIPLANWYWQQERGEGQLLIHTYTSLVHSPIVIVTWEEFARDHTITGFQSLHELAISSEGDPRFAHTDPQLSNSGLMSLILEVAVAADKDPKDLVYDDLTRDEVKNWLKELESRAVLYGGSTGFLVAQAVEEGPTNINALVVYENLVLEKNLKGEPQARWGQKLVAIYPEEGTLSSDHPFCILNASWISEEQRLAAEELLRFFLRAEIQEKALKHGFRPENKTVELDLTIFNPDYGILYTIPCPILENPTNGEVLWHITDLWLVCKAGG